MSRSITGYGEDYEKRVSDAVARSLLPDRPLPPMGYEVVVRRQRIHLTSRPGIHLADESEPIAQTVELVIKNCSGQLALACTHDKEHWPKLFGIDPEAL